MELWAAVIGAIASVGVFWLGQESQRRADATRWKLEAGDRRLREAAPVLKSIRNELRAAARLLTEEVGRARAAEIRRRDPDANPWRWEPPEDEEITVHTDRARDLAFEVPDTGVAAFVKFAAYALDNTDTVNEIGGPYPWETARDVENEVDGVIGAYLHGQPIPDAPKVRVANEAVAEHWKQMDEYYELEHKERQAKREAAQQAKREAAAQAAEEADGSEAPET